MSGESLWGWRTISGLEGYDVEVVGDGVLASRRARDGDFDLILLDVMLPGRMDLRCAATFAAPD